MRQAQQHGFHPSHPNHICQDLAILQKFTRFDYDLSSVPFIDYFEGRTGVQISWCACGWDHVRNCRHKWTTWDEFVDCRWANKIAIWAQPDPNDEPWRRILRAQMQDCWELWCEQTGHEDLRAWKEEDKAFAEPEPAIESEPSTLDPVLQLELF